MEAWVCPPFSILSFFYLFTEITEKSILELRECVLFSILLEFILFEFIAVTRWHLS